MSFDVLMLNSIAKRKEINYKRVLNVQKEIKMLFSERKLQLKGRTKKQIAKKKKNNIKVNSLATTLRNKTGEN